MTIRFRLSENDCISINRIDHRVQSQNENGIILRRLDDSSLHLSFTHGELVRLLASADMRLKRGYFSSEQAGLRTRCDIQYISSLPLEKRATIFWKTAYCHAFLEAEARGEVLRTEASIAGTMAKLSERVDAGETLWQRTGMRRKRAGLEVIHRDPPSVATLRLWLRSFEKFGRSPLAFLRKKRADLTYSQKFLGEAAGLLAECVTSYLSRDKPTQKMIVNDTKSRFSDVNRGRVSLGLPPLPIPSERTILRQIAKLDPFEVVAQRKGVAAAKLEFSLHTGGLSADRPLERIEMDEWQIDIMSLFGNAGALDPLTPQQRAQFEVGRRWLYLGIDCATRCVVSLRLAATPSAVDAIRALELITVDKTPIALAAGCETRWDFHGGIGSLVTDQGIAFTAPEFQTAITDLGAKFELPPAGVPKLRPHVERIFGTLGQQLAPMLIGRTFSNVQQRGDYPSEQWASLTDDELAEIFTRFIVDIYHNTPHSGLGGETPANAWKRLGTEIAAPPPDATCRRVVFGIPQTRKLGPHGVTFLGINYTSTVLQEIYLRSRGQAIDIRVDRHDLTTISFRSGEIWDNATAVPTAVHGLSIEEWQTIVRDLRVKYRNEAVLTEDIIQRARSRIREIDQNARRLKRIQPTTLTAEQVYRCERNLFLGLRIEKDRGSSTEPDDLLNDVIEETPTPPKKISPTEDKPKGSKKWRLSDD